MDAGGSGTRNFLAVTAAPPSTLGTVRDDGVVECASAGPAISTRGTIAPQLVAWWPLDRVLQRDQPAALPSPFQGFWADYNRLIEHVWLRLRPQRLLVRLHGLVLQDRLVIQDRVRQHRAWQYPPHPITSPWTSAQ